MIGPTITGAPTTAMPQVVKQPKQVSTLADFCIKKISQVGVHNIQQLPTELQERIRDQVLSDAEQGLYGEKTISILAKFQDPTVKDFKFTGFFIPSLKSVLYPNIETIELSHKSSDESQTIPGSGSFISFHNLKDLRINWKIYANHLKDIKSLVCERKIKVHVNEQHSKDTVTLCFNNLCKYREDDNVYTDMLVSLIENGQWSECAPSLFMYNLTRVTLAFQDQLVNLVIKTEGQKITDPVDTRKNNFVHLLCIYANEGHLTKIFEQLPNLENRNALNADNKTALDIVETRPEPMLNKEAVVAKMIELGYKRASELAPVAAPTATQP